MSVIELWVKHNTFLSFNDLEFAIAIAIVSDDSKGFVAVLERLQKLREEEY